jgi:hypothetical protein
MRHRISWDQPIQTLLPTSADSDFALPTAVSDFNIFILKRFVPEVTGASLAEVIADTG